MVKPKPSNFQELSEPLLRDLLQKLLEHGALPPRFWGTITLHVQDGRLNHTTLTQTFRNGAERTSESGGD